MKQKMNLKKILVISLIIGVFIFLLFLINILNSKVSLEGDCSVEGLSLKMNETYHIENVSLSEGTLKCHFKGEGPLLLFLGR